MGLAMLLLGLAMLGLVQSRFSYPVLDCKYGQLPGRWVNAAGRSDGKQVFYQPVGIKQDWKLFDARCRLQPLADQLLSSNSSQTGSRVPILLIGDSTDRFIQQDVCELGKMVGARTDSIGFDTDQTSLRVPEVDGVPQKFECNHCSGCVTDFATIGHSYVWGVSPTGPYHYNKTGGWMERIPDVIASFRNLTGRDPEMVVFASNFWDIASWGTRNASILDMDDLEDWVMDDFNQNMSHVLSTIESLVPDSAIKVFKTSAWPEPADCMGQSALKGYLGRKSHVAQLNAAGKHMAAMHGWEVVDLEPMVAKFGHPSMYLRDNIHPHMFLNIEIFNIYLNILRAHGHFMGPAQTSISI